MRQQRQVGHVRTNDDVIFEEVAQTNIRILGLRTRKIQLQIFSMEIFTVKVFKIHLNPFLQKGDKSHFLTILVTCLKWSFSDISDICAKIGPIPFLQTSDSISLVFAFYFYYNNEWLFRNPKFILNMAAESNKFHKNKKFLWNNFQWSDQANFLFFLFISLSSIFFSWKFFLTKKSFCQDFAPMFLQIKLETFFVRHTHTHTQAEYLCFRVNLGYPMQASGWYWETINNWHRARNHCI